MCRPVFTQGRIREGNAGLWPGIERVMLKMAATSESVSIYEARLHREGDLEAVAAWAAGNGMAVIAARGRRLRIRATVLHARALAELLAIASLEEWTPPRLVPDHVGRIVWGRRSAGGSGR